MPKDNSMVKKFTTPNDVLAYHEHCTATMVPQPWVMFVSEANLEYLRMWSIGDMLFGVSLKVKPTDNVRELANVR